MCIKQQSTHVNELYSGLKILHTTTTLWKNSLFLEKTNPNQQQTHLPPTFLYILSDLTMTIPNMSSNSVKLVL